MLLALLTLALPTVALANSITYTTGDFLRGEYFGMNLGEGQGTFFLADVFGTSSEIGLVTGPLTLDSSCFIPGATCHSFSGSYPAIVNVFESGITNAVFHDHLSGGVMATTGVFRPDFTCLSSTCTAVIEASLAPSGKVDQGTALLSVAMTKDSHGNLTSGGGVVTYSHMPEPSALEGLLLGIGGLGLAELTRRKLKLGA